MRIFFLIFALLSISSNCIAQNSFEASYEISSIGSYKVIKEPLNCRSSPTVSSNIVKRLNSNDIVKSTKLVLKKDGTRWLYIEDGCYILGDKKFITLDTPLPFLEFWSNGDYKVIEEPLNCRSSPMLGKNIVKQLNPNDIVKSTKSVRAKDGTAWLYIEEKNCYIRANSAYIQPIDIPEETSNVTSEKTPVVPPVETSTIFLDKPSSQEFRSIGYYKIIKEPLNCRSSPALGKNIVKKLNPNEIVNCTKSEFAKDGAAWLFIEDDGCYIRANSAYIQPTDSPEETSTYLIPLLVILAIIFAKGLFGNGAPDSPSPRKIIYPAIPTTENRNENPLLEIVTSSIEDYMHIISAINKEADPRIKEVTSNIVEAAVEVMKNECGINVSRTHAKIIKSGVEIIIKRYVMSHVGTKIAAGVLLNKIASEIIKYL